MIVFHRLAETHVILELLGPVRRGGRVYASGHQFAAKGPIDRREVHVAGTDGEALVIPAELLRVVSTPRPSPATPGLAVLLACGLVKRGADL